MNHNDNPSSLQVRLQQCAQELAQCPQWTGALSPEQLPELLSTAFERMLQTLLSSERDLYLDENLTDRANGYAPTRTLHVGLTPVQIQRPRTRKGFYPAALPKHQRHLASSYARLLEDILLGARSFSAARRTLQALGLGYSPAQVDQLLDELYQEAKTFFTRPLSPDWLCLFADAKIVELKDDQDHVKQAVHFLVIGITPKGHKEILTAASFWGSELLDSWRKVLLDLRNRGVVRVLQFVTDDFSGLIGLLKGLFPQTDHQLCCVHLLRNAHRHLSPEDFALFKQTWHEIYNASSFDSALAKLRQLIDQLRQDYKSFAEHLDKRAHNYVHFTKYPAALRAHVRTTNLPEGLNSQIENLRRNAGGHFHSEREVLIKMKLLVDQLYDSKWKQPNPRIIANLSALTKHFHSRFETELNPENFLTQSF